MNELIIKQYDIDYSFIIKNYLDKELWNKEWTLFVYKDYVFSLQLYEINTRNEYITFEIKIKNPGYNNYTFISYYIKQSNLKVLKKQINGAMFNLIEWAENKFIKEEEGYKTIQSARSDEIEMLENIANDFLDDNGVNNKEIREVYIDNYVSNNTKTDTYLSNYMQGRKYQVLSDLYLVSTKAFEDKYRHQAVVNNIKNNINYAEILEEANSYINKLENEEKREELEVEFKECLEAI